MTHHSHQLSNRPASSSATKTPPPSSTNRLNLLTEDLISLAQAASMLQVHVSAVYRWANTGARGIKLEIIRVGGKLLTSQQAVKRFLEATQG